MAVTPSGIFSIQLSILRTMISQSSSFQTWTGTANAAAALARIYFEAQDDSSVVRPFALVFMGNEYVQQSIAGGASQVFQPSGQLVMMLEDAVAPGNAASHADAYFAFANELGDLIEDLMALGGTDSLLSFESIALTGGPGRTEKNDRVSLGDNYTASFNVNWEI
jgi:hypothetical protein